MEASPIPKTYSPATIPGFSEKLTVNHSRLLKLAKSRLKNTIYFKAIRPMILHGHIFDPFTLIIIMRSKTSLTYC